MRKLLIILVIFVSMVGMSVVSAGPPVHQANGGATWITTDCVQQAAFNVRYNARVVDPSDPFGLNATGQLQFFGSPPYWPCNDAPLFHAALTCLHVQGNEAWIGGWITSPLPEWAFNGYFVFYVQDNGEGYSAVPDRVTWPEFGIYRPCTDPYFYHLAGISQPVLGGNIQVK